MAWKDASELPARTAPARPQVRPQVRPSISALQPSTEGQRKTASLTSPLLPNPNHDRWLAKINGGTNFFFYWNQISASSMLKMPSSANLDLRLREARQSKFRAGNYCADETTDITTDNYRKRGIPSSNNFMPQISSAK